MTNTIINKRIEAIDQLRGLVIVLMGLDHVRDFFSPFSFQPEDMSQTSPELFFTRWITHFCAPVFVFLTGISAWLYEQKRSQQNGQSQTRESKNELRNFLLSRGIWLIFIEVVVVNASWKFNFAPWVFLQVIWAIGVSMIILAGLIYLPKLLLIIGSLVVILGHNLLDPIQAQSFGDFSWLWGVLHENMWISLGAQGSGVYIAYPLLPWCAVMALGYGLSGWLVGDKSTFINKAYMLGLCLTIAFVLLRFINGYGDPQPWEAQSRGSVYTLLSFLNTQKYPPSLLYLCMTIGPAMMLLALMQKFSDNSHSDYKHSDKKHSHTFLQPFLLFGRVPFFYYVAHLPLIHVLSLAWFIPLLDAQVGWQMQGASSFPAGYEPSMLRLYAAWVIVTVLMYFACRWFAGVKQRHNHWILKYL